MASITGFLALGGAIADGVLVEPRVSAGYARRAVTVDVTGAGDIVLAAGVTFGPATASWRAVSVLALLAGDGLVIMHQVAFPTSVIQPGQFLIVPAGTYAATLVNAAPAPEVVVADALPVTVNGEPLVLEI